MTRNYFIKQIMFRYRYLKYWRRENLEYLECKKFFIRLWIPSKNLKIPDWHIVINNVGMVGSGNYNHKELKDLLKIIDKYK